jgi:hypothetical protein
MDGKKKPRFETPGARGALIALAILVLLYAWTREPGSRPAELPSVPSPQPRALPAPTPKPSPEPPAIPEAAPIGGCPEGCDVPPEGCDVKGNISLKTGERIYHLRGQRWYGKTVIDPEKGERWFCTAGEAEANGWRRSKV